MEGPETSLETGGAAALEMAASAALERGEKIIPCRNCGAPVLGIYCGQCGQPVETHRRSVFHLLRELIKDIASFDSRILRTARAMFFQPGELALAFREGRMQRYVPPVRLYLFVSIIFFLVLSVTQVAILQLELTTTTKRYLTDANGKVLEEKDGATRILPGLKVDGNGNITADGPQDGRYEGFIGRKADGSVRTDLDVSPHFFIRPGNAARPVTPELRAVLDRMEKKISGVSGALWAKRDPKRILETLATDPASVNGPLTEWIPRMLLVLLPVFAVVLAVFYWRQRAEFYFVDHLVFSLNAFSFAFVVLLFAIVAAPVVAESTVIVITLGAICLHLLFAMKHFYEQSWGWAAAKFVAVSFINVVFFLGPALLGILLASLWNLS